MVTAKKKTADATAELAAMDVKKAQMGKFKMWFIGHTPLIVHAWSHKAKDEMLGKQIGRPKAGKAPKDPHQDFIDSLYEMGDGAYGFPAMGIKNCILSSAHKDKGVPRSVVNSALFIHGDMTRLRPALHGAICDMPLLRIYGSAPEMREDMVKIGAGLNKTANLAYRGQFTRWAMQVRGKYNASVLNGTQLGFLIEEAGLSFGVGEWRNEKRGVFGAFHLATAQESKLWDEFKLNSGQIPPDLYDYDDEDEYLQAAE